MSGTKANHRQYAAPKLITRLTGPAGLLRWAGEDVDFEGEQRAAKMLQCSAASPLVRRISKCSLNHVRVFQISSGSEWTQNAFLGAWSSGFWRISKSLVSVERKARWPWFLSAWICFFPEITGLISDSTDLWIQQITDIYDLWIQPIADIVRKYGDLAWNFARAKNCRKQQPLIPRDPKNP